MSLRSSPERGGETKHERAVEIEPSVVIEGMRALDFKSDDLKFMAAAYMARRNNRRIVRGGLSMAQPISSCFNSSSSCLPLLVIDCTPFRVHIGPVCLARLLTFT